MLGKVPDMPGHFKTATKEGNMKTKLMITGLLSAALIAAPMAPALARDFSHTAKHPALHVDPRAGHRDHDRHDRGDNVAAGVFLGLAALTTFAILSSATQPAPPPRPVYATPVHTSYGYPVVTRRAVVYERPVYSYPAPRYMYAR